MFVLGVVFRRWSPFNARRRAVHCGSLLQKTFHLILKYRSRNAWVGGICGLCLSVTPHVATAQFDDDFVPDLTHIATYHSGIFDEGAAEIAAYDADLARVYFTNGDSASIDVLDVSDPTNPVLVDSVSGLGESVNSVAVSDAGSHGQRRRELRQGPQEQSRRAKLRFSRTASP